MNYVREAIVIEARQWIGTPFRHQASVKGVGCDCIGLIAGVGREMGFKDAERFRADPRFRGYARTPEPQMLQTAVSEYLEPVKSAEPGDIMLFRFKDEPQHFALVVDRGSERYMVHSYMQARGVVENRIDEKWARRMVGAYKYREVP